MKKHTLNSIIKGLLTILGLAFYMLAIPQAQAATAKRVYTGLSCQAHDPEYLTLDIANNTTIPNSSYYGSGISNDQVDPVGGYSDLGMNCAIDRSLFGAASKLQSVKVSLSDASDPAVADDGGYCHTHIEYVSAGTMNVIYGTDVFAADVPGGTNEYQTLTLPQTVAAPTNDANYDIHCHINGSGAELNSYKVVEQN
jgi:hypothetical protein